MWSIRLVKAPRIAPFGGEEVAEFGKRHRSAVGDLGKADVAERLLGGERHEGIDYAIARRACRFGPARPRLMGFLGHRRLLFQLPQHSASGVATKVRPRSLFRAAPQPGVAPGGAPHPRIGVAVAPRRPFPASLPSSPQTLKRTSTFETRIRDTMRACGRNLACRFWRRRDKYRLRPRKGSWRLLGQSVLARARQALDEMAPARRRHRAGEGVRTGRDELGARRDQRLAADEEAAKAFGRAGLDEYRHASRSGEDAARESRRSPVPAARRAHSSSPRDRRSRSSRARREVARMSFASRIAARPQASPSETRAVEQDRVRVDRA